MGLHQVGDCTVNLPLTKVRHTTGKVNGRLSWVKPLMRLMSSLSASPHFKLSTTRTQATASSFAVARGTVGRFDAPDIDSSANWGYRFGIGADVREKKHLGAPRAVPGPANLGGRREPEPEAPAEASRSTIRPSRKLTAAAWSCRRPFPGPRRTPVCRSGQTCPQPANASPPSR
jgi:hypothetical protein